MKFPVKIRILKNIDTSQLNLPLTQHSIVKQKKNAYCYGGPGDT